MAEGSAGSFTSRLGIGICPNPNALSMFKPWKIHHIKSDFARQQKTVLSNLMLLHRAVPSNEQTADHPNQD